jgi:hypothetical protein
VPDSFVRPHQLFLNLDGQTLTTGDDCWQVEIYSVNDQNRRRWVQAGLVNQPQRYMLTLELPEGAGASTVKRALASWLNRVIEPGEARIVA